MYSGIIIYIFSCNDVYNRLKINKIINEDYEKLTETQRIIISMFSYHHPGAKVFYYILIFLSVMINQLN